MAVDRDPIDRGRHEPIAPSIPKQAEATELALL
jgi:hypothetical protein